MTARDVTDDANLLAEGERRRHRAEPELEDGNRAGADEVIALLRSSGYWDAALDGALARVLFEVTQTFHAAYRGPSSVFKSVIAREDGELIGHVSSLRAYDRTWMTQHLATSPDRHVADLLSLRAGDHLLQTTNIEFFKIWYQHHKPWPSRVFGGFAQTVTDANRSDLRGHRHVSMTTTDAPSAGPDDGIEVGPADDAKLAQIAGFFAVHELPLLVRADDLHAARLSLDLLEDSFATAGLSRCRRVLVATRGGACLGFALAELSSVGLNLYEILSAFRLFVFPESRTSAPAVRAALLRGVARLYRSAGRATAHGLVPCAEILEYLQLGLEIDHETWMCWTFDRTTFHGFRRHVAQLFERLRRARFNRRRAADPTFY
jgi:hypothetical protein